MWVLVAVLTLGADTMAFVDPYVYSSYSACHEEAQVRYEFYMATRPDPDATALVWCTEQPKGI